MKAFKLILFSFLLIGFSNLKAQDIDWYEVIIIPELQNAHFLVVDVDSVGKKCRNRDGRSAYCTLAEKTHDRKLKHLHEKQKESLKNMDMKWTIVDSDSLVSEKYDDKEKYRFIIDYDYDLIGVEKNRTSLIYLKLDFIIIDRISGKILGRTMKYDITHPFKSMEVLVDELHKINQLK